MATAYTTVNKDARSVTLNVEGVEVTMPFTTFRNLFKNGMQSALVEVGLFKMTDFNHEEHF
jgi:hypothetical protein